MTIQISVRQRCITPPFPWSQSVRITGDGMPQSCGNCARGWTRTPSLMKKSNRSLLISLMVKSSTLPRTGWATQYVFLSYIPSTWSLKYGTGCSEALRKVRFPRTHGHARPRQSPSSNDWHSQKWHVGSAEDHRMCADPRGD